MEKSIIDKVEAEIAVDEAKTEKKKQIITKLKYSFIILILVVEAVILGIQVYNRFVPNMQYKEAVEYYEAGNQKEALLIFEKLGEYKNSEYFCNLICTENPSFRFDHCKVGDEITFGKYNYEDIEWVVISASDDNVLLLSKYIIEADSFPEDYWFRTFVNSSFYGNDKNLIEDAYLLDADDATDYINGKNFAKTSPTKHALSNEEYQRDSEYGYGWWLDTSSSYLGEHRVASDNGDVGYNYEYDSTICGIRPAISIKLSDSEDVVDSEDSVESAEVLS